MQKACTAIASIVAVVMLGACASSPIPTKKATPVANDRIFAPHKWLKPCADCGTLIVKRDGGTMIGAGSSEHALINGHKIADLWPGEKITLYLPAGHYVLSATFVSWAGKPAIGFVIDKNQTLVYRLAHGFMGEGPKIYPSQQ